MAVMVLLSLFILHLSPLSAQSYAGVSLAAHMPMVQDNSALTRSRTAFGGEIGGVYEWHSGLFMLQTGLNYNLLCPSMRVENTRLEQPMIDTRGVPFLYCGELKDRTDRMTLGQLTVPFSVGVAWKGWHLIAGLRLAVMLHADAQIKASLQTVGDYQGRYYDLFENMPNHGFHDFESVRSSHALTLNRVDVRLCAETGYTFALSPFNPSCSPLLRIAAFAEYGLMSMRDPRLGSGAPAAVEPDYEHYMSLSMTHLYAAASGTLLSPHMLTFGLRIALLFPLPGSSSSHHCNCYGNYR